ncbi:hypothetical protein ACB098_02G127300 [Castanea mollissima]
MVLMLNVVSHDAILLGVSGSRGFHRAIEALKHAFADGQVQSVVGACGEGMFIAELQSFSRIILPGEWIIIMQA